MVSVGMGYLGFWRKRRFLCLRGVGFGRGKDVKRSWRFSCFGCECDLVRAVCVRSEG